MRKFVFFLTVVLLFSPACDFFQDIKSQAQVALGDNTVKENRSKKKRPGKSVIGAPPLQMREALLNRYRLKPDQRFVRAIPEIHHILTMEERSDVKHEFRDGQWTVSYKGEKVGHLPEMPSFQDLMSLLEAWVIEVNSKSPLKLSSKIGAKDKKKIEGNLHNFISPYPLIALKDIDKLWAQGIHDPDLLIYATQAMVDITLQTYDMMETADDVFVKAISLLALTKTLTSYPAQNEESLLSYETGYSTHATKLAQKLPESDPGKLYILRRNALLKKVTTGGSNKGKYLYLLRLAKSSKTEEQFELMEKFFREEPFYLPFAKVGLKRGTFSTTTMFAMGLPYATILEMEFHINESPDELIPNLKTLAKGKVPNLAMIKVLMMLVMSDTASLSQKFESNLTKLVNRKGGIFLDSKTLGAYYRGHFYSGLFERGEYFLDSLSSIKAVKKFLDELGEGSGGASTDFRTWYSHLAQFQDGKADVSLLIKDFMGLPTFGARPLIRSYEELKDTLQYGDSTLFSVAERIANRMDTRTYHRFEFGNISWSGLHNVKLAEKLYSSVLRDNRQGLSVAYSWYAKLVRDQEMMHEFLKSDEFSNSSKAKALAYLADFDDAPTKLIESWYERLIANEPENWRISDYYIDYLEENKMYKKARKVAYDWLRHDVAHSGLRPVIAKTAIARMHYHEKQYQKAWKVIKPVISSWQSGAMQRAAIILDKLGKRQEAEDMFIKAQGRYPGAKHILVSYAKFLWSHKRYKDAAKVIKRFRYKITWRWDLGPKFAEVFVDKPTSEGVSAFKELMAAGFGHFALLQLTYDLSKEGSPELAFKVASLLRWQGLGQVVLNTTAYDYLEKWKGHAEAIKWFRKNYPPNVPIDASAVAFMRNKKYDLLWEFIKETQRSDHGDFVWLIRASAARLKGFDKSPHKEELLNHYKGEGYSYIHDIGKFMVGYISEEELLPIAGRILRRKCAIAYYIGVKAESEGRLYDASDWYRVSVETMDKRAGEYRWAHNTLRNWYAETKTLAVIQADREKSAKKKVSSLN